MVKNTFVVKFGGYFGFGPTLEEATEEFVKAGGNNYRRVLCAGGFPGPSIGGHCGDHCLCGKNG